MSQVPKRADQQMRGAGATTLRHGHVMMPMASLENEKTHVQE